MLDASRVTLRGIYLIRVVFGLNTEYEGSAEDPSLVLFPKWAFPTVVKREAEKTGVQQHVVLQVWFRNGKTSEELTLEKAPLRLQVDLLGDYEISGSPTDPEIEEFSEVAVAHIFPYAREAADRVSSQTWHPRVMIPLVNLKAQLKAWRDLEASTRAKGTPQVGPSEKK